METQGYSFKTLGRGAAGKTLRQRQGTIEPYWHVQLLSPDGSPLDTTGFQYVMLVIDGHEVSQLQLGDVDHAEGHWMRAWTNDNVDRAGTWKAELQGANASGGKINFGDITFIVEPSL